MIFHPVINHQRQVHLDFHTSPYDSAVLDDASELKGFELLILPDSVRLTPAFKKRLRSYLAHGGKVLFSHRSGFEADGKCSLPGVALRRVGEVDAYPTYWRTKAAFSPALSRSDRVIYLPGDNIVAGRGITALVQRVLPYFKRNDLTFSSHFQTPPIAKADRFPAIMAGKNFIYFADPIFREYRQFGNIAVRDAWKLAMRHLVGPAPFGDGLPSTVLSVPRRRGPDLMLTLLLYPAGKERPPTVGRTRVFPELEHGIRFLTPNLSTKRKTDHTK